MENHRRREAFERIRDQIGFCGIWCGSCAVGNGCVAELAVGLRELLAAYDGRDWASLELGALHESPNGEHLGILDHMRSDAAKVGLSVVSPGDHPNATIEE